MAERRSLGDAIEMTPAKLAFIKGQPDSMADTATAKAIVSSKVIEKTVELGTPLPGREVSTEQRPKEGRRTNRRSDQSIPGASEILDQVLVPVTIRLHHRTAQALKRAYLEQKLRHAKPDTLQKIGEEAIADWLSKNGYLD